MSEHSPLDVPEGDPFGPHNLPYGVFSTPDGTNPRVGVRYGDYVLDTAAVAAALGSPHTALLAARTLAPLMAAGRPVWQAVRAGVTGWLTDPAHRAAVGPHLHEVDRVVLHMPFEVGDYVDFYSSEHHAANVGRIFRPGEEPLTPNWKHLPIGYHGRSGTIVPTGTPVVRPAGQRKRAADDPAVGPGFGPSIRLDIEAEVGFVIGVPSRMGTPVPRTAFRDHVFGVCLVNDWSARDVQPWEQRPLGPHQAKSFATSIGTWITPLDALEAARVAPPERTHPLLPYLDDTGPDDTGNGYDLRLEVRINGETVSRPPFAAMYWTAAQQLAHMTVNGASVRTGDLYASGTVSGPEPDQVGSLLELTKGKGPWLEDGDTVAIDGWAPGPNGVRIALGGVHGQVKPTGWTPPQR
ncbi:fumarylacetoacetate hydrolase family protein [Streptomyces sp. CMB-StM0423]|uniref:fumarylacetoacetate hydrolase family protein n=1 Tax=Streptomyces sp. CMB-StM0423 TaxID=2059884 RepID=UPI000C71277D|nr:fumarylacetoacetate hydrolase family protein [Streptomyces sp. CMB-StM0423]AUH41230.1 fumarylacetoacetase [Streptomyces sp. CMB-StM0423]